MKCEPDDGVVNKMNGMLDYRHVENKTESHKVRIVTRTHSFQKNLEKLIARHGFQNHKMRTY